LANISWDENKLNNIKTQYKNEGKMGQQAEKELGVEEENLAFWLDAFKMEKLQKEIMPHLMNDIGQKLW
jgi:hypothetical protein